MAHQHNILMVCLGNICRSPLAEGLMDYHARQAGLPWQVDSAGTGSWHVGQPPHHQSQQVALHYGLDISQQRARQFTAADMERFDRIYFMDQQNMEDARQIAGPKWQPHKAALLLHALQPGAEVPDPYSGTEADFHAVYHLISRACQAIIQQSQPS
jgi:protein-tyrosine phosphatase